METNDLKKDDEVLREIGFTDGPKKVMKFILRPVTPCSLSWLQRNKVFDGDFGDMIMKTAAFAYLHSAEKQEIRSVVNSRVAFLAAVDEWIEEHILHHRDLEPVAEAMNEALECYMAATTTAANPSAGSPESKN